MAVKVLSQDEWAIEIVTPGESDRTTTVAANDINSLIGAVPEGRLSYVYVLSEATLIETARFVMARLSIAPTVISAYLFEIYPAFMDRGDFNIPENDEPTQALRLPYGIEPFKFDTSLGQAR
jgi:hypothetical protein